MKLFLYTLISAFIASSSLASEVRELNVHRDSALISEYDTHIKMTDARYVMLPKTIRLVPTRCHSDSESDCTRAEVLRKVPVVQVIVQYRDGVIRDENSYKTVDLEMNLPASAFTAEQLSTLQAASRPSFSGRNHKIRQEFIQQNLGLEITRLEKPTRVLDEDRSELCEGEYAGDLKTPGCREVRRYKTKIIKYKHVKVVVNNPSVD